MDGARPLSNLLTLPVLILDHFSHFSEVLLLSLHDHISPKVPILLAVFAPPSAL